MNINTYYVTHVFINFGFKSKQETAIYELNNIIMTEVHLFMYLKQRYCTSSELSETIDETQYTDTQRLHFVLKLYSSKMNGSV